MKKYLSLLIVFILFSCSHDSRKDITVEALSLRFYIAEPAVNSQSVISENSTYVPVLTEADIMHARAITDQFGMTSVMITFTKAGAVKLYEITKDNTGKKLIIVMNQTVLSDPVIKEKILNGRAMIYANFPPGEAKDLARKINNASKRR